MTNKYSQHKSMNHLLLPLLMTAAALYLGKLWRDDARVARAGSPNPRAFPGATNAPSQAVWIAVIGALLILATETVGEIALGIAAQQSRMTVVAALYAIAGAPIIEELVFRGWLVIEHRGKAAMWLGAVAASGLFAILHSFLWKWDEAGFGFTLETKGWFSTAAVFVMSLWLYAARLANWNPHRSLLPCFAAHATKNLGVVAVKATAGFLVGWW